ncbi:hypothetical protein [Caulobacter sp. FWC2]|uniref:hypothetical protein n=1 Tax=Caulobacter sp. FWC2 TaxID=69664 RepID=UPI000C14596A|nr:hypothetical protein [Caulobacter sp. FWC2]PIB93522.1 hypothetical protein CSW62_19235 [Caulobacter sp. FWC2]
MPDDPKANANAKPGAAPDRLRPTIIEPPAKREKRQNDATPIRHAGTPTVTTPTAIPGVARKRIAVSPADMTRLSPGVSSRTAARAVWLVESFVAEGAGDRHVTPWGRGAQQRHAALISEGLAPSDDGVLIRTRGHVGRIVEILETIDVEATCDGRRAPLLALFEAPSGRIDSPRKLTVARAELAGLIDLTRAALDPLRTLEAALCDHSRRIDETRVEIEAAALGALFLSEHLATSRPELSRRFLQREMSLTQSAVEIRGGQFERDSQVEDARALIATIQDVVLATLVSWLGDMAIRASRRPATTEVAELRSRLRAILRKLAP